MSLEHLLRKGGEAQGRSGLRRFVLCPALPTGLWLSDFWDLIWLGLLWRLRRGLPYTVTFITERMQVREDVDWLNDFPLLELRGMHPEITVRLLGRADFGHLRLTPEDDSLLFLPTLEAVDELVELWPEPCLRGTFLSTCDELIVIDTADAKLLAELESLPQSISDDAMIP